MLYRKFSWFFLCAETASFLFLLLVPFSRKERETEKRNICSLTQGAFVFRTKVFSAHSDGKYTTVQSILEREAFESRAVLVRDMLVYLIEQVLLDNLFSHSAERCHQGRIFRNEDEILNSDVCSYLSSGFWS